MTAECRSCHARIDWAVVAKSGKRIPLDPEPVEFGNIAIVPGDRATINVEYVLSGGGLFEDRPLYVCRTS